MSGFDWYKRTVNSIMPGFSQQPGQAQRFAPANARPMSPPPRTNNPYVGMGVDPMGNYTGMPSPDAGAEEEVSNPYLQSPQSGAAVMNDPNAMTPSSYAKPSFRQAEVASMDAYKKLQAAGGLNPVKAQAPAAGAQAGFYYLDDGKGNVRPYGYSSSAPMIPGYNAVRDPNGRQTFGGMPQPMAQAPAQPQPTLRLEGEPDPNAGFFARLFGGR